MEKNDLFGLLYVGILDDDRELIFSVYDIVIQENIKDKELVIRLMQYMYDTHSEEEYIKLLKHISHLLNDSEIAYFVGFYFLIKNSPFHAYLSFKMVEKFETKHYYKLAKHNIEFLEKTNSQLTQIIKKSLEKAISKEPNNISLIKQLDNLNEIEKKMTETVLQIIEFTKDDNKKTLR